MSARTRRQKAALAAEESDSPSNGSSPSKRTPSKRAKSAARDEPKENIFLFTPNLIGMIISPSQKAFRALIPLSSFRSNFHLQGTLESC